MQRGPRIKQKAGFTIFEVAMAAAVMALAISTSLVVMGRGFASLDSARCISYASQIMQSELEKMRLTQWGDGDGTAAGNGTTGVSAYPTTLTTINIDPSFTNAGDVGSRMTLQRIATFVHTGMIKVTLTITWTTFDRRTLSRSYITYYGKNGLYDFFIA
jgi:Tfp pilus assembly protein PilV